MDVFGRIAYQCVFTIGGVTDTRKEQTVVPLYSFQHSIVSRVCILSDAGIGKEQAHPVTRAETCSKVVLVLAVWGTHKPGFSLIPLPRN